MSKAFGEQNPTLGETAVSWQTFTNGSAVIPDVVGDVDWGKLKLDLLGQEGRSAVYDLGAAATRKFTLTENRYGAGAESATIQIRGDTSAFVQDDVLPAWETYTAPVSKGYRYVQVRATTVASSWWLSGGITPANCIAAYQAKGAADYAGSKVNLANPSTYDAVDGAAYPTWDITNGWKFVNPSSQYLTTGGIQPAGDQTWSMIARYSNLTTPSWAGLVQTDGGGICLNMVVWSNAGSYRIYVTGNKLVNSASKDAAGIIALAGRQGYFDGLAEVALIDVGSCITGNLQFCKEGGNYISVYIQAFAIYNIVLDATQIGLLTTAMAAL